MSVTANRRAQFAPSSFTFDWVMGVLGLVLVAGVFQDGWAHNHGKVDQSFFTPWHAVLYGMMALNGAVLGAVALYNFLMRKYPARYALPFGYMPALTGVLIFAAGGVFDLWWHTKYGIEADLEALVSPSHLLLAVGASLILTAPLRSVASRVDGDDGGWPRIGPAILSCTAMLGVIGFFTVYTNPNGNDYVRHIIGPRQGAPVTSAIYTMRDDGSDQRRVVSVRDADAFLPAISPDGDRIAYSRSPLNDNTADIMLVSANGTAEKRLVSDGRRNLFPAFSPDGKRIAFVSVPAGTSGTFQLRVVNVVSATIQTLVDQTAVITNPAWTPNGKSLYFATRRGVDSQIGRVDIASRKVRSVDGTDGGGYPAVSPDGKQLAFIQILGRKSRLAIVPASGGAANVVASNVFATPMWSPDGKQIAFTSLIGDDSTIGVIRADGSSRRDLAAMSGFSTAHPSWSRNHRIAFSARGNQPEERTQIAGYFVESNNLVNALILSGFALLLVRRFRAPFGALTFLFTIYGVLMATQEDTYFIIPVLFASGLIGDTVVSILQNRVRSGMWFYALGSALPLLYFAFFIVAARETTGLDWAPNLVFGSPILAGITGLFVAFCFEPPLALRREAA